MFNGNNFATSAALAEVCDLLSAILVAYVVNIKWAEVQYLRNYWSHVLAYTSSGRWWTRRSLLVTAGAIWNRNWLILYHKKSHYTYWARPSLCLRYVQILNLASDANWSLLQPLSLAQLNARVSYLSFDWPIACLARQTWPRINVVGHWSKPLITEYLFTFSH